MAIDRNQPAYTVHVGREIAVIDWVLEPTAATARAMLQDLLADPRFRRGMPVLACADVAPLREEVVRIVAELALHADQLGPVALYVDGRALLAYHAETVRFGVFGSVQNAFAWIRRETVA